MTWLSRSRLCLLPQFKQAQFYLINLLDIQDIEIEQAKKLLDEESLSRANKRIFREDQHRSTLVYAFLRFYLARLIKQEASTIKVMRDTYGKPYLENATVHFSLSHTTQYALLAFHPHHPIGVDIERIRDVPDFVKVADLFMHPNEKDQMMKSKNSRDYFFSLWCAKEAFLKTGGISFDQLPSCRLDAGFFHDSTLPASLDYKIHVYGNKVKGHKMAVCELYPGQ